MAEPRPYVEGVPEWMAVHGIKKGEYLMLSKAQLRSQQRPDKPLKVQVWATGMLHTAGYRGQQAFTMRGGKKVPLTTTDIIRELHEAAKRYFASAGIELSEAELATLKETKETIRRALSELEADGISQRTDQKGRPLSELSPEESRKLSQGRIRLFFWLKPRNAAAEDVAREWHERQLEKKRGEVDKICGPLPPINKILNIFNFRKLSKTQISDAELQAKIAHAWEESKAAFKHALEVDNICLPEVDNKRLPAEVDTQCPPEVDITGGAFERIVGKDSKSSSVPIRKDGTREEEEPQTQTPDLLNPASFHEAVARRFAENGKSTPSRKKTAACFEDLHGQQADFVAWLTPARLAPVKTGGILLDLLQNFTDEQAAGQIRRQEMNQAEQRSAQARQRQAQEAREQARRILSDPNQDPEAIEFAKALLAEQGAA